MRAVAVAGLALTLGVLAVPRHGTPSERREPIGRELSRKQALTSPSEANHGDGDLPGQRPRLVALRSLGVSLAADRETIPAEPTVDGKNVEWWSARARSNGRTMRQRGATIARLHAVLERRPTVHDAIRLAATVYRVPYSTLDRKAWCESRFSPAARNPSGAMGLFQFLGSTWRTTPFAGFSPYDPFAASLAAGWMHLVGRGGEWSCR